MRQRSGEGNNFPSDERREGEGKLFIQLWIRVFSKYGLHSCRSMVKRYFGREVPRSTFYTFGVEDFIKNSPD